MDIINPEIFVIGKRYYRRNCVRDQSNEDIPYDGAVDNEESCENIINDVSKMGDDYYGHIDVPPMFICFIIGKGGETKKRVEFDTQTSITIPKTGKGNKITVKGKTTSSVDRALTRIAMLVDIGRSKLPFTHFLSIPANISHIQESFECFKNSVLHECVGDRNVEESVFQRTYKLHVTISVLVLGDHNELEETINVCNQFRKDNSALFSSSMRVRLCGIDCMNDDPREVRVLYAKVKCDDECNQLQMMADKIVDYLVEKRVLLQREYNQVTLHMTLMNANFNKDKDMELDNDARKVSKTIDCSNIMKKFLEYDFGYLDIHEIQLCKRHIVTTGNYYQSVASFLLDEKSR